MEVGGFFEFPEFDCKGYPSSALYYLINIDKNANYSFFRDGRQAIKSVLLNIEELKDKICYLPAYLCYSILQPFRGLNLKIKFYNHQHPLKPAIDENIKNSLLYIIDYFGTEFVSNEEICKLLDKNNVVILDITHSIFDKNRFKINHENLYLISSLRKVFPIPDGGILYYTNSKFKTNGSFPKSYESMLEAMVLKSFYLKNLSEPMFKKSANLKNCFLTLYKNYEIDKDEGSIQSQNIPSISLYILKNINISNIVNRRSENLNFMYKNISNKEHFLCSLSDIKSPFTIPLIFESEEKRNAIKELLIKDGVYPPIHWNLQNMIPKNYLYEHELNKKILSIPIDQRYDDKDMLRAVSILNGGAL
jgi:phage pi2 protein 07